MRYAYGPVDRAPAQLALDAAFAPASAVTSESFPGAPCAWTHEEIVRLHFILLDDLRRLADSATPLEERFELIEWLCGDGGAHTPFSFAACVRLAFRTADAADLRDALRPLAHEAFEAALAALPAWLAARIRREPEWAAAALHRDPQWLQAALRADDAGDLFGGLRTGP